MRSRNVMLFRNDAISHDEERQEKERRSYDVSKAAIVIGKINDESERRKEARRNTKRKRGKKESRALVIWRVRETKKKKKKKDRVDGSREYGSLTGEDRGNALEGNRG